MPRNNRRMPRETGISIDTIWSVLHEQLIILNDENFMLFATHNSLRLYVFICFTFCKLLFLFRAGEIDRWCIDSTFATCPVGYKQLLVLGVEVGASAIPIFLVSRRIFMDQRPPVQAPMVRATTESYEEVLRAFKQSARNYNVVLKPAVITCDYELAQAEALRKTFSNTPLQGCSFHFKRAVHRNWRKHVKMVKVKVKNRLDSSGETRSRSLAVFFVFYSLLTTFLLNSPQVITICSKVVSFFAL